MEDRMASPAAKTERITILGTPQFKKFLTGEAKREGVSVSELIRRRCQHRQQERDEDLLLSLAAEVRAATEKAQDALTKGLHDAEHALAELSRGAQ
jgi:hypothetical protein